MNENPNILSNEPVPDGGARHSIKSYPNKKLSFVRFLNQTQRKVEVIWINYEGARVRYKTLEPQDYFDVNTYVAHPWVFQDAKTREYLLVDSKDIYEPGPWYEEYLPGLRTGRLKPEDLKPKRITVNITSPLYSLKNCAINTVLKCTPNLDRLSELELPHQLLEELKCVKSMHK